MDVPSFTENLFPEAHLLVLCARRHLDEGNRNDIQQIVRGPIQWDRFLKLVRVHGVHPLVYRNLNEVCPDLVPSHHLESLGRYYEAHSMKNRLVTRELLTLLNIFSARGLQAVPFKGPTLAIMAYGDLTLREFVDVDILVKPEDLPEARKIMRSQGYQPVYKKVEAEGEEAQKVELNHKYFKCNGLFVVDLQWHLAVRYFSFSLNRESFWRNIQTISINGKTVPTFFSEDLLVTLCVHGTKHVWESLKWICDIAELIQSHPDMDWEKVLTLVDTMHCRRAVYVGIFLAQRYFRVTVPPELMKQIESDPDIPFLGERVPCTFLENPRNGIEVQYREAFFFMLKDSWFHRWWFGLNLCYLMSPVIHTPLPWFRSQQRLLWFYKVIHPFHLLALKLLRSPRLRKTISDWLAQAR